MDLQDARDRRGESTAEESADRDERARERAADARLRRAIRDVFARQASGNPVAAPELTQPVAPVPHLRLVRDDRP